MEFEVVRQMTAAEYGERLLTGWRRFGHTLFRPRCPACSACRSLRVQADRFQPNRSQRRVARANRTGIVLDVGRPSVTAEKLALYNRYHAYQSDAIGWPQHTSKDPREYLESFVLNPFATEEWRYLRSGQLVGLGYVDVLPVGLSAIYYFYDPRQGRRSLGTWNILTLIEQARNRGLPNVYLGYYVAECRSLAYKACFRPHQVLEADGRWSQTGD